MANQHLSIYLNDHLAGSVTALELLGHLDTKHHNAAVKQVLSELHADITTDRRHLEALMKRLNVGVRHTRKAMAWLGEKVAEVKLRLDDPDAGAMMLLESLDVLSSGIEGKRLLWRALSAASIPEPPGADYESLQRRATEQRERLEKVRLEAAREALGTPQAVPVP